MKIGELWPATRPSTASRPELSGTRARLSPLPSLCRALQNLFGLAHADSRGEYYIGESCDMNHSAFAFTAVVLIVCGSFAAAPWKTMQDSAEHGYSEAMDAALSSLGSDAADSSNCYDACAPRSMEEAGSAADADDRIIVARNDDVPRYADRRSAPATR